VCEYTNFFFDMQPEKPLPYSHKSLLDYFRFFGYIRSTVYLTVRCQINMERTMEETPLKRQLIQKIKQLSPESLREVLDFVDLLQTKMKNETSKTFDTTGEEIIRTIEASGSVGIYFGDPNEVYALDDGKPILWDMPTIRVISKRRLVQYLNELIALAKTVTPDVEAEAHVPGFENQHARLEIYVPDELEEQISDLVSQRTHEIFIDTGYDIGASVFEKSELLETATTTTEAA